MSKTDKVVKYILFASLLIFIMALIVSNILYVNLIVTGEMFQIPLIWFMSTLLLLSYDTITLYWAVSLIRK
jgi:hypothetical protein